MIILMVLPSTVDACDIAEIAVSNLTEIEGFGVFGKLKEIMEC